MLQFKGVELGVPFFPRSITRGEIKYERRGGEYVPVSRSKVITIALKEFDHALRQRDFASLIEWMGNGVGNLEAYDVVGGYLTGAFSELPNTTWGTPLDDIELEFYCDRDPYYHSVTERNNPVYDPVTIATHHADWRITQTIETALTDATWTCNGASLVLTEVPAGNLVIDSLTKSITLNDSNMMQYLTFDSRFPVLGKGTSTFTMSNGAGGTLYTREAWL